MGVWKFNLVFYVLDFSQSFEAAPQKGKEKIVSRKGKRNYKDKELFLIKQCFHSYLDF